jgi:protocatechuate 3,4-dioxygenase beta subunit
MSGEPTALRRSHALALTSFLVLLTVLLVRPSATSQQPAPPSTGFIVGQVIDFASGRPVPGAVVALSGSGPPAPAPVGRGGATPAVPPPRALTDGEGRFLFRNVPRGSYALNASRAGYVDGAYGRFRPNGPSQLLELGDRERRTDVVLRVFRNAAISGTVVDERGEPVAGMTVRAYRRTLTAGRRLLTPVDTTATTDDRGAYRLPNLRPGEFIVAVPTTQASQPIGFTMQGGAPLDLSATMRVPGQTSFGITAGGVAISPDSRFLLQSSGVGTTGPDAGGRLYAYASAYYPSSATAAQATPVSVAPGEDRTGIDIALKFLPTANVSGRLLTPEGPGANYALHLVPSTTGDMTVDPDVAVAITDREGTFMFLGVPAGQYVIQTVRPPRARAVATRAVMGGGVATYTMMTTGTAPAGEPTLWAAVPLSVGGEDVSDLTISLREGLTISGRAEFEGAAERPPAERLAMVPIEIEPADGKMRATLPPATLQPNGQFVTSQTPPGRYLLRIGGAPGGWTTRSVLYNGVDISDTPVDLTDRDLSGVVVTFTDRISSLSGTVRNAQGGVDDSAAVLVFPLDVQAWANYGFNPRRMRSARTSTKGLFSFSALPAGEYFAIAIGDEFAGEWQDPRMLEALARQATRITITEGQKLTQDLSRMNVRPPGGDDIELAIGPGPACGPFVRELESTEAQPVEPGQVRDARPAPPAATSPAPGTASLGGQVVTDDDAKQPVRRARVTVAGAELRVSRSTLTDDEGRFTVAGLPPGRYAVSVSKTAFLTTALGARRVEAEGSRVALVAGQAVSDLKILMPRGGVIAGTVTDEFGQPVPNLRLEALRAVTVGGERRLQSDVGSNTTDDRGMYRVYGLRPGSYVVALYPDVLGGGVEIRQPGANDIQAALNESRQLAGEVVALVPATPASAGSIRVPGRSVGYAPVFYPGTPIATEATAIALAKGQELPGVDLTLRLATTAKIEGTVIGLDGRSTPFVDLSLVSTTVDGQTSRSAPMGVSPEGKFSRTNLAPGRYTIRARAPDPAGSPGPGRPPTLWAEQEIEIRGEDLTGITLVLQQAMVVSGRVVFEGKTLAPPANLAQLSLILNPTPGRPGQLATVAADGTFKVEGVMPGEYRLDVPIVTRPGELPSGWQLKAVMVEGRDTLDSSLVIRPGQHVSDVTVAFTDQTTELTGRLLNAEGMPISDLQILLFSTDRSHWNGARRLRGPTQPANDGTFRFLGVAPGDYYLAALSDVDPDELRDPAFLEQVAQSAIRISMAFGEKKRQDLKVR